MSDRIHSLLSLTKKKKLSSTRSPKTPGYVQANTRKMHQGNKHKILRLPKLLGKEGESLNEVAIAHDQPRS